MRPLSAPELLTVWEEGLSLSLLQRALRLLAAACPETSPQALAQLSIGRRDARLLTLREWTFGARWVGWVTCPGCGERLELTFHTADLRADGPETGPEEGFSLSLDGYDLCFRLPNSLDLAAIDSQADLTVNRNRLLERCLLAADYQGEPRSASQLPARIVDAIMERMAQADPQAEVQLALSCPSCGHQWQTSLDIPSFFWSEINAWAHRLLLEVHTLASAYGWREMDILSMSPWRRQFYLNLVNPR